MPSSWYAVEWIVHTLFALRSIRDAVRCPEWIVQWYACHGMPSSGLPHAVMPSVVRREWIVHALCVRWYACASMVCRPRGLRFDGRRVSLVRQLRWYAVRAIVRGLVCVSRLSRLRRWYACLATAQRHALSVRIVRAHGSTAVSFCRPPVRPIVRLCASRYAVRVAFR